MSEIVPLKGADPKPPIKPLKLKIAKHGTKESKGKDRCRPTYCKTQHLEIHEEIVIMPAMPPLDGRHRTRSAVARFFAPSVAPQS